MEEKLAINGGKPLASYNDWPKWPVYNESVKKSLEIVLNNNRWTVSGFYTGAQTFDEIFCEEFSRYNQSKYALTIDHGSSAILIALQALGITKGDEVIVSSLTWVACASVILRANATPVFVDIEESTLCMDPFKVEEAITPKTRAILVVHLYSCMAELNLLKKISIKYNIPIIEDCSQAHGAVWDGHKSGTIGDIGIFSMQQGKPLTCGEGGAIITNDKYLYSKMIKLKNDGRLFKKEASIGYQQLIETGGIIGGNYALSEFQCAILYENLKNFDNILTTQRRNALVLASELAKIPGLSLLKPHSSNNLQTYYHFVVLYEKSDFNNAPTSLICDAISQELGCWVHSIYQPLYRHILFDVSIDARFQHLNLPAYKTLNLPICEKQAAKGIAIPHSLLLSEPKLLNLVAEAFQKVKKYSSELLSRTK